MVSKENPILMSRLKRIPLFRVESYDGSHQRHPGMMTDTAAVQPAWWVLSIVAAHFFFVMSRSQTGRGA